MTAEGYRHGTVPGERAASLETPPAPTHSAIPRTPLALTLVALCACAFYWAYSRFDQVNRADPAKSHSLEQERTPWARQFPVTGPSRAQSPLPAGEIAPAAGPFPFPPGTPGDLIEALSAGNSGLTPAGIAAAPISLPTMPGARAALNAERKGGQASGRSEAELLIEGARERSRSDGSSVDRPQPAPDPYPTVLASVLEDRDYLLAAGSSIECALQTRIDSTLPGMTSCLVTRRILSDTGRLVLLDRGSLVTGEYRSALALGQRRLFVLWKRIKTPLGVTIDLESPGTDALGASGLEGELDEHWGERIGAAFLLSVIQDGIAYSLSARSNTPQPGTTVVLPNTVQTGNQMAGKVLDGTIGIAPTLTKPQGDRVAIIVARDLRFDSVYGLGVSNGSP
jgi:type IV secretion system protein VirB10